MTYGTDQIPMMLAVLFKKDQEHLDKQLKGLIEENHALGGNQHGFLFQGLFCSLLPKKQHRTVEKRLLRPELHEQGRQFFAAQKLMAAEQMRLKQGLGLLLRDCYTPQDTRDALPDLASLVLPEIAGLPRTRPEAWPIIDKPLHVHNYTLIADIFGFYAANQLLY